MDGETLVFWNEVEQQDGGETYAMLAARVSPTGRRVGDVVPLVRYAGGKYLVAAFVRGDVVVVVTAANEDFDWPRIGLRVLSRADLSERVPFRVVRRISGAPSGVPAFDDLRVAALDDRDALVVLTIDDRTYRFVTSWAPPPTSATTGPLPSPLGEGLRGVDLLAHSTSGTWIAYGDGTNVHVGTIDATGDLDTIDLGPGRNPVVGEAGGRTGVLYVDELGRARFVSLAPGDTEVPDERVDLGPASSTAARPLALAGHAAREHWWVARVASIGGVPTVSLHDIVPSGATYVDREVAFGASPAGAGGVAVSVVNAASVLAIAADGTLRGAAQGCF